METPAKMEADTAEAREANLRQENAKKAREAADKLFPNEQWSSKICTDPAPETVQAIARKICIRAGGLS